MGDPNRHSDGGSICDAGGTPVEILGNLVVY